MGEHCEDCKGDRKALAGHPTEQGQVQNCAEGRNIRVYQLII